MSEPGPMDVTGGLRSPAATPGHWAGCAPPNKGQRYPADPPTVEEIILVMRQAGPGPYADRTRGLIAILWRAGLRISEALALTESDLDPKTGSVLVRSGLCRIRHKPCYAESCLMPSRRAGWAILRC
jgi:integrase